MMEDKKTPQRELVDRILCSEIERLALWNEKYGDDYIEESRRNTETIIRAISALPPLVL